MDIIAHNPATVTSPSGGYTHGLEVQQGTRMLFISGQIPELPDGRVPESFAEQCHAVWHNILAILAAADMTTANLVKVTTFLTDREQAAANGEIRRSYLADHHPALTVIVAQTLESSWLLEVEAMAMG